MKKKIVSKLIKIFIILAVGLIIFYFTAKSRGLFDCDNKIKFYMAMSDGFLLPGFIILGLGALVGVTNAGMFDIFAFSFGRVRQLLKRKEDKDPNYPKTFFDYRTKYQDKKLGYMSFVIIGVIFMILSLIYNNLCCALIK